MCTIRQCFCKFDLFLKCKKGFLGMFLIYREKDMLLTRLKKNILRSLIKINVYVAIDTFLSVLEGNYQ